MGVPDARASDRTAPERPASLGGWVGLTSALLAIGWGALIVPRMVHVGHGPPFPAFAYVDFRDTIWLPIQDFLRGDVPWDIPNYLNRHPGAQEFLLYVPVYFPVAMLLALLPYDVAAMAWLMCLCTALVLLIRWSLNRSPVSLPAWMLLPISLILSLTPVVNQGLRAGQFAVICALGVIWALHASPRRAWLGVVLAFIKPPVGVPLVVALLVVGRARVLLRGLLVAAAICLPFAVVVLMRLGGVTKAMEMVSTSLDYAGTSPYGGTGASRSTRIDLVGALGRADIFLPPAGNVLLMVAVAALSLVALFLTRRAFGMEHPATAAAMVWVLVGIVPNELYAYVVAVPALILTAAWIVSRPADRRWSIPLAAAIAFPFVHVHRVTEFLNGSLVEVANGAAVLTAGLIAVSWATWSLRTEGAGNA